MVEFYHRNKDLSSPPADMFYGRSLLNKYFIKHEDHSFYIPNMISKQSSTQMDLCGNFYKTENTVKYSIALWWHLNQIPVFNVAL